MMNARLEIDKLKKEFVSLKTEEERLAFDSKFRNHIASKNENEKKEFADAFIDSAREQVAKTNRFCDEVTIRLKLEEILGVISMAYIAREYFHKSKAWFSQKLNGNIKNGVVSSFSDEELKILHFALEDIVEKIKNTARLIA